jgi:hypothetical protein
VLSSAASCLWKSFRRSRTPFGDRPETVRLHPGSGVHLHPGILFEIIPEHRSESYRNRVHPAPESPSGDSLPACGFIVWSESQRYVNRWSSNSASVISSRTRLQQSSITVLVSRIYAQAGTFGSTRHADNPSLTVAAVNFTTDCCDCLGSAETRAISGFRGLAVLLPIAAIF